MGDLGLPKGEVPVLGRLAVTRQEPLCSPKPRDADRRLSFEGVVLVEPHSTLSGAPGCALLFVDRVGSFPSVDAFAETAQPPGRLGMKVQAIRGRETVDVVHRRTGGGIRCLPVMASKRLPRCRKTHWSGRRIAARVVHHSSSQALDRRVPISYMRMR